MRKLAINPIEFGDMLDSHPEEDELTLNLPEAGTSNKGRASLVGVAEEVRQPLDLSFKIHKSGLLNVYENYKGGEILAKLNNPVDTTGSEYTDSQNWMGSDSERVATFIECHDHDSTGATEYYSPKVIRLNKWLNYSDTVGYDAMAVACKKTVSGATVEIRVYRRAKREQTSGWAGLYIPGELDGWSGISGTPVCDLVEMDDGTIVLAVVPDQGVDENVYIYRSFDCGDTWEADGGFDAQIKSSGTGDMYLALERIGSRLVMIISSTNGSSQQNVKSFYSDDVGYNWSTGNNLVTAGTAVAVKNSVDLLMSKSGKLLAGVCKKSASGAFEEIHIYSTLDGITWTAEFTANAMFGTSMAMMEDEVGRLVVLYVYYAAGTSTVTDYILYSETFESDLSAVLTGGGMMTEDFADVDFHATEIGGAALNYDGHFEMFVKYYDNDTNDTYAIVNHRSRMWSSIPIDQTNESFWCAAVYPSASDPAPDLNIWSRTGTGTSTLEPTTGYGHLKLSTGLSTYVDYYKTVPLVVGSRYSSGLMVRFSLRVDPGIAHVRLRATDGSTLRQDFYFIFSETSGSITLWDGIGSAQMSFYTPTNWSVDEVNHYMILYLGDFVGLYRASRYYNDEVLQWEEVITESSIPNTTYAAPDSEFHWGVLQLAGFNLATTAYFGYMSINQYCNYPADFDIANDTDDLVQGKKASKDAIGLTLGVAHKIAGSFVVKNDNWEMDTGAQYQAENIFNASPSIRWQEPKQSLVASVDQVFQWTYPDDNYGKEHKWPYNCVGLFGKNFNDWKLERQDTAAGLWTTIMDTKSIIADEQIQSYTVNTVEENVLKVLKISANEEDMLVNQYGSTFDQNFYIQFTSGFLVDRIYKVERAELYQKGYPGGELHLYMPYNMQQMGVLADDGFKLFTDRCFLIFDTASPYYNARSFRFTIHGSVYTDPLEDQFRLGTFFVGMYHNISDDEWSSSLKVDPNNLTIRTRAGREINRPMGRSKRTVDLSYSGQIDRGMFKNDIRELMRQAEYGNYPLVWIDNDAGMFADSNYIFHQDPLLCRMQKGFGQPRRAYYPVTAHLSGNSVLIGRNIVDVNSIVLEEII